MKKLLPLLLLFASGLYGQFTPPPVVATQAEAEAGTNNSKFMSPLRTAQAITAGGSGAPTNATYITQTANGGLSAEQALSLLGSGLVYNTTTTGVLSIVSSSTVGAVLRVTAANTFAFGTVDLADGDAITGTLSIANGGTASTTASAAVDALGGAAASGSGGLVRITGASLVTPGIGAATGTSLVLTGGVTSGSGGSTAGFFEAGQGTAPSAGTTSWKLYAPTSVTSYITVVPGATGTGLWLGTNSAGIETITRITPAAGVTTFIATSSSANLAAALTDETGTGAAVFAGNGQRNLTINPGAADDTWAGNSFSGLNNSGGVTQWDAVYLNGSSQWVLADANGASTYPCRGLATTTQSTGVATVVIEDGVVRNDAWAWTPGGTIYLSTTAGGLTQTAPSTTGDKVQAIGYAIDADTMRVKVSSDYGTAP